ncbi:MAG: Fic family protein [Ignavibacteria bacterium]|nr:Fic family protein [Ignavibacteria bacterium]
MNQVPDMLNALQTSINTIEEQSAKLKLLLPMQVEFQQILDKKFRMEFNYNSNHLEGNTLTYGETELLLIFDRTTGNHSHREYEEMKAHDVAFQLIDTWAKDQDRPLTESDIRNLHKSLLIRSYWSKAITSDGQNTQRQIQVGDYKKHPNTVILSNGEKFEFASVTDTPILMSELIKWYHEEEKKDVFPPFVIAALFHYKFVRIHPFDDGNGRIARLLMNYILLKNNLPPVVIKSADKAGYLTALNKADTGDLDSFIYYIAKQLEWSLDLSIKAAHGESIEEPDDVDKEISIWKKQVSTNSVETLRRNDELIYHLYTNGIKELFVKLEDKFKQLHDVFHKSLFLHIKMVVAR